MVGQGAGLGEQSEEDEDNLWWDRVLGAGLGERSEEDEDSMDYG